MEQTPRVAAANIHINIFVTLLPMQHCCCTCAVHNERSAWLQSGLMRGEFDEQVILPHVRNGPGNPGTGPGVF